MPPFDFPNKFSVPFKKRFITLSSSLLMDLLIKVTGYNSKFFFLLKTGLEVQTNAYSQSAKQVIRKIRLQLQSYHSSSIRFFFRHI